MTASCGRPCAIFVKGLSGVLLAPMVQQNVASAAIKTAHMLWREHAEIGDAADIEHSHRATGFGKKVLMERRNQRCALTACGNIAAAKVSHHAHGRQLGKQRRIVDLQAVPSAVMLCGLVANGLSMRTDGSHIASRHISVKQQLAHGLCIYLGQRISCQRGPVQFIRARLVQLQKSLAQCRFKRQGLVTQYTNTVLKIGQYSVHAIQRSTRHHADIKRGHGNQSGCVVCESN